MRVLKWIFLGSLLLVLVLIGGLFAANWYVGVHGLPASVEERIRAEARKQGLALDFTNARLINLERLELLDVAVADSAGWKLLQAERITVWVADVLEAPHATGAEIAGELRLPLRVNETVKPVVLKGLHLHALVTPERLHLASFHAQVGCIQLRVSGGLHREAPAPEAASKGPATPAPPVAERAPRRIDIAALIDELSPPIRRAIDEALEICDARIGRGKLEVKVDGSVADIAASTVDFDVHLAGLLARGVSIDTFAANGRYRDKSLVVPQLYLGFDGDESLRGNASFADGMLAAEVALRAYPEKVARVLELKLPSVFPEFGAPVDAELRLPPTKLDALASCEASGSFAASELRVFDGGIRQASARIAYRDKELFFDDLEAELSTGVRVTSSGRYDVERVRVALEANILGHPGVIADFSPSAEFRELWGQIWSRFHFAPERPPRFVGTLQWQKGWPDVVAVLRGEWANVAYNGVDFDRATAEAVYDGPDKLLLLSDMDLQRAGRWLRGRLAWQFGSRRLEREHGKIEFEASSSMGSPELFDVIGLPWGQRQTAAGTATPMGYTAARGAVHFGPAEETNLRLFTTMPSAKYGRNMLSGAELALTLHGPEMALQGKVTKLENGDWTLGNTDFEFVHGPDAQSLSGAIQTVEAGVGLRLRSSQFETDFVDGAVKSLAGTCAEVKFQDAVCDGVSGKVDLLGNNGYAISAEAQQGQIGDFQTAGLSARMEIVDGRTRAEFAADNLVLPEVARAENVQGKVMLDGRRKVFRLRADNSAHLASDARTEALTISGSRDGEAVDVRFETPKLYALEDGELDEASLHVSGKGGALRHSLTVGKLRLGKTLKASRVSGEGPWLRHSFNARFTASELTAVDFPFSDATGTVSWTRGHLSLAHLQAGLFGGKASGSAFYNTADKAGSTWWTLEDLALRELNGHFAKGGTKPPKDEDARPTLDGKVNLSMSGWGKDLSLHGNGHVAIKDGNFVHYRVPIVSDFLELVTKTPIGLLNQLNPLRDLGKITRLRTDLIFEDDRILIPNLRSNGGVIAISADGYYRWKDPWIEIRLRAGSLPKIWKHIPLVSDPFEVLLERKAVGPPDNYKWQEISGIRELFEFNKDEEKEPKK